LTVDIYLRLIFPFEPGVAVNLEQVAPEGAEDIP